MLSCLWDILGQEPTEQGSMLRCLWFEAGGCFRHGWLRFGNCRRLSA